MPRLHADHSRLTGSERRKVADLLLDTFDPDTFDNMLANQLGLRRVSISMARNFESILYDVIDDAERKSYTAELLQAARAERQRDVGLLHFAQKFDLEPSFASAERLVRSQLPELDAEVWLQGGMTRLGQVCRVEVSPSWGTGFLVAPNLVLTNYHVVDSVIDQDRSGSAIQLRFDERVRPNNPTQSKVVHLPAQEWLVAASPDNGPGAFYPTPSDALDYALLRTEENPGDALVDSATGQTRGWVKTTDAPPLMIDQSLLLLGHPNGKSLKLTLDTQSVIKLNATGSRVRYRTNSDRGSSGSPCFDLQWNLVALHHAGDKDEPPQWNQGIPVAALRQNWSNLVAGNTLADWQRAALTQLLE